MTTYQLPNLEQNLRVKISYIINKKQYHFYFQWVETFTALSIYIIRDNQKIYLVKNRGIMPNVDIIARVKDSNLITGKLIIKNKYEESKKIRRDNFHTDFEMEYYAE